MVPFCSGRRMNEMAIIHTVNNSYYSHWTFSSQFSYCCLVQLKKVGFGVSASKS